MFSRDGSQLFYFDGEGIVAAAVSYGPTIRVGPPQRVVESGKYLWNLFGRTWDPDPAGERFLLIREPAGADAAPSTEPRPARVEVVLNWFEELRTRVPVGP